MEMIRMSRDLRLKKDVELSQAAYLKFHSVFNEKICGLPAACFCVRPARRELMG